MDYLLMEIGNAKVLNVDTGDDLLTETGMSNYEYTYVIGRPYTSAGVRANKQSASRSWCFLSHMVSLIYHPTTF
jgi:hypothetical protein